MMRLNEKDATLGYPPLQHFTYNTRSMELHCKMICLGLHNLDLLPESDIRICRDTCKTRNQEARLSSHEKRKETTVGSVV